MESSLTTGERRKLTDLESTIEHGLSSFFEVGSALITIRDGALYTDVHKTFEGYCKLRWKFSASRARQLIGAASAAKVIKSVTNGNTFPNERVARELAAVESDTKKADVWSKAIETAPKYADGEPKVTASHVRKVRDEVLGNGKKHKPKAEKQLADDEGHAVPSHLNPIFEMADEFEEHAKSLTEIQKWATDNAKRDWSIWLHVQSLVADLENAKKALRFNKPYAVCPYCHAKKKQCEGCKGHGFVSKGIYKAAPQEMRA